MESNELTDWVTFFNSVFGYSLNPSEISIGVKPAYSCEAIVIPRDDAVEHFRLKNTFWKPPLETFLAGVYEKCLDTFPYSRWTPKPQDYWNGTNFFSEIRDCSIRPSKPYLVWVKIPDFARESKISWEERWDKNPGTTFLEQMLLDLFWWNKYKTLFGMNRGDGWKENNYCLATSILCNGSRFREGCVLEKEHNENPLMKYFGHEPTYLIPDTSWGQGGWYVSNVGYKTATTPSPMPCLVSF